MADTYDPCNDTLDISPKMASGTSKYNLPKASPVPRLVQSQLVEGVICMSGPYLDKVWRLCLAPAGFPAGLSAAAVERLGPPSALPPPILLRVAVQPLEEGALVARLLHLGFPVFKFPFAVLQGVDRLGEDDRGREDVVRALLSDLQPLDR